MYKAKHYVNTLSLRNLLQELNAHNSGVCFRFRLLGEMWKPNFMRIVKVTDSGAILTDELTKEFVFLSDLSDVVQFELDNRHKDYEPHFHYEVAPLS
jgi:hypothetical protein